MGTSIVKPGHIALITLLLVFAAFTSAARVGAKTPAIESISVLVESTQPEQVVFKLNGSHTPKTFRIDGERPRLVFDFYGINYPEGVKRISDVGGKIISGLRVGMHRDPFKTRVVVDIQKNTPYQYDYSFNVSNNSLVVTLIPDEMSSAADEGSDAVPVHLGFEQLKVVYDSAAEEAPEGSAEVAAPEAKQSEPQPEETSDEAISQPDAAEQTVAVIAAGSAKKIISPPPAAAEPQEAEKAEDTMSSAAAESEAVEESDDVAAEKEASSPASNEPQTQESEAEQAIEGAEAPAAVTPQVEPILLDVSFEESINNSETVLFRLNHFSPPLVFGIEKGEPRVVCDFMDASIGSDVPEMIETDGRFVNRISVARLTDPDKVRVELVLVPNRHYDLQQLFFKEDNLFVVIVKELQKDNAQAN